MNENLKFRTIREGIKRDGKPFFVFRIQGGVWVDYYKDNDAYYLRFPLEVATAIREQWKKTFASKEYLTRELEKLSDQPREYEGKVYESSSLSVVVYELREQLGEQGCLLKDVALQFSEYQWNKKTGIRKQIVQFVKGERAQTNYLGQDDFFEDLQGSQPIIEAQQALNDIAANDDLPF